MSDENKHYEWLGVVEFKEPKMTDYLITGNSVDCESFRTKEKAMEWVVEVVDETVQYVGVNPEELNAYVEPYYFGHS